MNLWRLPLLIVGTFLIGGCANRIFVDSPDLTPESFETGRVIEAMLIGPLVPDWSRCGSVPCVPARSRQREDLVAARERLGVVRITTSELPVTALASGRPSNPPDMDSIRILPWEFHTVVRLDGGGRIRIIGADDNGLSPGDRVRVGIGTSSGPDTRELAVLIALQDREPDSIFDPP